MSDKIIIRHDQSENYVNLLKEAQLNHPGDPFDQLEYVRENGTLQDYALFLVSTVCTLCICSKNMRFSVKATEMDFILRSFSDALSHMQEDLPDGVYYYIVSKMNDPLMKVLKKIWGIS